MDLKVRLVKDFFWLIVTMDVCKLFGKYELFELFEDGSESLINSLDECYIAVGRGNEIGIELGRFNFFKVKIEEVNNELNKFKK